MASHFGEYSLSLAKALAASHEVLLLINESNLDKEVGDAWKPHAVPNLTIVRFPHRKDVRLIWRNAALIVSEIRKFKAQVVHAHEDPRDYVVLALMRLRDLPFVLTIHDPVAHSGEDSRRRRFSRLRIYISMLRRRADQAIVHGEFLKSSCQRLLPRLRGKTHSIMHGPLGQLFGVVPAFDWQAGNCLFFGRIEAYKGLPYFIEAIRIARKAGTAVKGVIAGQGPELDQVKDSLLADAGFEIVDRYLAPIEVIERFRQANVVVLPYIDATQSGVAAYALGLGRPVVASRIGGLPELVRDGFNGVLVPPRDASALATAMADLVNAPEHARALASNALQLANGEVSWREIALQAAVVYQKALDGFRKGGVR